MTKVREMRTQFLVEASQNFAEWQSFVDSCDSANIFQTSYWAKALREAGSRSLLLMGRDENDSIVGGMLASYTPFSFLGLSVIPSISVFGGPVVNDRTNTHLLRRMFVHLDEKAKKLGIARSFVRSFFPLDDVLVKQFNYVIEHDRLPCTVILDLTKSDDDLLKGMSKRGRWGIRKAQKEGVNVSEARGLKDLSLYYEIGVNTSKRLGLPSTSFQRFRSLWKAFAPEENMKIFLARYHGRPIAGCIILRWGKKMWYWHSSSLKEYWRLNPNHLLQWHAIKWGKERGVRLYDFLGIPCKGSRNHPKYGLYLFKTQFGGRILRHGEYIKHHSRLRSALFRNLLPIYSRFSALQSAHEVTEL